MLDLILRKLRLRRRRATNKVIEVFLKISDELAENLRQIDEEQDAADAILEASIAKTEAQRARKADALAAKEAKIKAKRDAVDSAADAKAKDAEAANERLKADLNSEAEQARKVLAKFKDLTDI